MAPGALCLAVKGDGEPAGFADWVSHQMGQSDSSYHQAAAFKKAMRVVLLKTKDEIIGTFTKKDQRNKASELLSVAETDGFWNGLQLMVQNLLPIKVALRSVESNSARLDQVQEQYGSLANHFSYSECMTTPLEKRWSKMDQRLFFCWHIPCTQPDSCSTSIRSLPLPSPAALPSTHLSCISGSLAAQKQRETASSPKWQSTLPSVASLPAASLGSRTQKQIHRPFGSSWNS